jgi:hypothetical protein
MFATARSPHPAPPRPHPERGADARGAARRVVHHGTLALAPQVQLPQLDVSLSSGKTGLTGPAAAPRPWDLRSCPSHSSDGAMRGHCAHKSRPRVTPEPGGC